MSYLQISNISKAYRRYPQKWGRFAEWLGAGTKHEKKWVLRDISCGIKSGESVGIIGINGAGKSTLLKIIAGTTKPTTGHIEAGGRIAALLELGMGFHPDFTGRQNVWMVGQLYGMAPHQIAEKLPEIESFAEIGDYIDQPVRVYSSGMQVRLAFSVATAVRPEILIVDEALSVGDAYFQHKSFDRIRQFRDLGTTLLFVSHSPGAVKSICDRALLLDAGLLVRDGAPDDVLDYYNAAIARQHADHEIQQIEIQSGQSSTRSGNKRAEIKKIELISEGSPTRAVRNGDPIELLVEIQCREEIDNLTAGFVIRDRLGNDVFGTNTFHLSASVNGLTANTEMAVRFSLPANLGVGSFSISVALHKENVHTIGNYDWWDKAIIFQVLPGQAVTSVGVCTLPVKVEWDRGLR